MPERKENESASSLQKVIANFTGITRNETLHNKNYLVAPAIMIVEGVLNGSLGPLFYPAEELKKSVPLWNMKPAVLYHPQKNGAGISACSPEVLNTRGLGMMMNTRMDGNQLKTEVWLDMDQVKKVDERVLEAVENKKVMELSTGLMTDNEMVEGEWDGTHYDAIARNYRPDHLAILPDQVGACSVEDGAGFLRLNKAGDALTLLLNDMEDNEKEWIKQNQESLIHSVSSLVRDVLENEMSDEDRRQLLQSLLRDKFPDEDFGPWIEDIFSDSDFFIYERDGKLYQQEFTETDDILKLVGIPVAVVKKISFEPILNKKGKIMAKNTKKKIVDALIKNESTQWTEDNREWLMTQEEDILDNMNPIANEDDAKLVANAKVIVEKAKVAEEKLAENKKKEEENVQVNNAEPETVESFLKKAPPEIRSMLQNGLDSHKADKKRLINVITANDRCNFSEEQLEKKDLNELRQLAALATTTDNQREELAVVNYGGQGETHNTEIEEEPLLMPTMNFEKPETAKTD